MYILNEDLKQIEGFGGRYYVDRAGNIYSTRKNLKPRKQYINSFGYCVVGLYENGKEYKRKVHKLVAEAFIPNPNNKPEVNHINGDKTDNSVGNLEWVTRSENVKHAYDLGIKKVPCKHLIKPVFQVDRLTGDLIASFNSVIEASEKTNINKTNISQVARGVKPSAGGYKWTYQKPKGF